VVSRCWRSATGAALCSIKHFCLAIAFICVCVGGCSCSSTELYTLDTLQRLTPKQVQRLTGKTISIIGPVKWIGTWERTINKQDTPPPGILGRTPTLSMAKPGVSIAATSIRSNGWVTDGDVVPTVAPNETIVVRGKVWHASNEGLVKILLRDSVAGVAPKRRANDRH
jgi:hypothetical protein